MCFASFWRLWLAFQDKELSKLQGFSCLWDENHIGKHFIYFVSNWIMFWQLAKEGLGMNDISCSLPISRHLFRVPLRSSSNKANFLSKFVTGTIRNGECLLLGFRRTKCFCFKSFFLFIYIGSYHPFCMTCCGSHSLFETLFYCSHRIVMLLFYILVLEAKFEAKLVWKEKHSQWIPAILGFLEKFTPSKSTEASVFWK